MRSFQGELANGDELRLGPPPRRLEGGTSERALRRVLTTPRAQELRAERGADAESRMLRVALATPRPFSTSTASPPARPERTADHARTRAPHPRPSPRPAPVHARRLEAKPTAAPSQRRTSSLRPGAGKALVAQAQPSALLPSAAYARPSRAPAPRYLPFQQV
jgi:hypothetical protein